MYWKSITLPGPRTPRYDTGRDPVVGRRSTTTINRTVNGDFGHRLFYRLTSERVAPVPTHQTGPFTLNVTEDDTSLGLPQTEVLWSLNRRRVVGDHAQENSLITLLEGSVLESTKFWVSPTSFNWRLRKEADWRCTTDPRTGVGPKHWHPKKSPSEKDLRKYTLSVSKRDGSRKGSGKTLQERRGGVSPIGRVWEQKEKRRGRVFKDLDFSQLVKKIKRV